MKFLDSLLTAIDDHEDPLVRNAAWEELTRLARIYVRARMGRGQRAHVESMDVVDSVLGSIAQDLRQGNLALHDSTHLRRHLHMVVRRKLADLIRYRDAEKRGGGRGTRALDDPTSSDGRLEPLAPAASLSARLRVEELIALAREVLSRAELEALLLYAEGRTWQEVGEPLNLSPDAARYRMREITARVRSSGDLRNH